MKNIDFGRTQPVTTPPTLCSTCARAELNAKVAHNQLANQL